MSRNRIAVAVVLLTLVCQSDTVNLTWTPGDTDPTITYRIYAGPATNQLNEMREAGKSTNYAWGGLGAQRIYFTATALATNGLESLPSNILEVDLRVVSDLPAPTGYRPE
jgi:hypothetical protein